MWRMEIAGHGTGRIEQLSSFAARCAEAINVLFSDLYRYEIFPRFGRDAPNPSRIFVPGRLVIEAISNVATEWVQALSATTGVSGLQLCTALPYDGVLAARRRFITAARRWCPRCLEEMADETGLIYEPLVWRVSEVTCCPRHDGVGLVERCSRCGRTEQTSLVSNSRVGCCRYCGAWLGRQADCGAASIKPLEVARANMCEEFVVLPQKLANGESIASSKVAINAVRSKFFVGSGARMARSIGVPPSHVNAYGNGDCLAPLDIFLRISQITGASMRDIFVEHKFEDIDAEPGQGSFPVRVVKPKSVGVSEAAAHELLSSIEKGGAISVREAARRANVDPTNVRRWYPDLTRRASALHALTMRREAEARRNEFAEKVRAVLCKLKQSGAPAPTTRETRVLFGQGATLNPWKRAVIGRCLAQHFAATEQANCKSIG